MSEPSQRRLPTFLVIGAMKAGTTSLHRYLTEHPQVFVPERKELHFFVDAYDGPPPPVQPPTACNWQRGLDWYADHFRDAGEALAVGELTPRYSRWPHYPGVPGRIASVIPDVRLVYVVREPVARMISQYVDLVSNGLEPRPMAEALRDDPRYVATSRYATQIDRYLEHFDRSRLHVMTSERLRSQPVESLRELYGFLGVDPAPAETAAVQAVNSAGSKRSGGRLTRRLASLPGARRMPSGLRSAGRSLLTRPAADQAQQLDPDQRAGLEELFRDEVERLRPYLPAEFDGWGLLDSARSRRAVS